MRITAVIIIILAVASFESRAQTDQQITSALRELFEFSKNDNFTAAADLIAYQGPDSSRNMRASYNRKSAEELKKVSRICRKIKALIDLSDSYNFGGFEILRKDGIDLYSKEVGFVNDGQSLSTLFYFVRSDGKTLLVKLD